MPDKALATAVLPTSDLAFKKILASNDHKSVTQGFIKDFFGVHVEVDDIHIVNPYSIKSYPKPGKDKSQVLRETRRDVTIELNLADVTVELQLYRDPAFVQRSFYYLADLYTHRYDPNPDGVDQGPARFAGLRPTWSLSIMGQRLIDDHEAFHMNILADEISGEPFLPQLVRFGFYELTKPDPNPVTAKWRDFLLTGVAQADDPSYLREAASIIDYVNLSPRERDMVTWQQKNADYYDGGLYWAKQEGIEQGIEQGTSQAKLDAARAAFRWGVSRDGVMAITGLDAATVDQLADELVPTS